MEVEQATGSLRWMVVSDGATSTGFVEYCNNDADDNNNNNNNNIFVNHNATIRVHLTI